MSFADRGVFVGRLRPAGMQALDDVDPGRAGLVGFGLGLAALLAFVVYAHLGVFVLGVFLYYATRPFYRRFEPRLPGSLSAALALLVLAVPVVVLVAYTAVVGYQELLAVVDAVGVEAVRQALPAVDVGEAVDDPAALLSDWDPRRLADAARAALGYLGAAFSTVLDLVVAFALAFYLLRDGAGSGRCSRTSSTSTARSAARGCGPTSTPSTRTWRRSSSGTSSTPCSSQSSAPSPTARSASTSPRRSPSPTRSCSACWRARAASSPSSG
jgi:hypothetical protein